MDTDPVPEAAREAHEAAGICIRERRFVDSIRFAEEATRLSPGWAAPWWNLTVGYKHARRWEDTLRACDQAIALDPADAEGPHWNAGIAATALGQWARARAAWAAVGITVPAGDGPVELHAGPAPIRIWADERAEAPEVVWTDRIDPCRARIRSIPLPDSGHRYDDLVLHDGEPRGKRRLGERKLSVFDELQILERSEYGTFEAVVRCADEGELAKLIAELETAALVVEDWTGDFRALCEACSLGDPDGDEHHGHAHDGDGDWRPERRLGIAARAASDLRPLQAAPRWWRRRPEVLSVRQVL